MLPPQKKPWDRYVHQWKLDSRPPFIQQNPPEKPKPPENPIRAGFPQPWNQVSGIELKDRVQCFVCAVLNTRPEWIQSLREKWLCATCETKLSIWEARCPEIKELIATDLKDPIYTDKELYVIINEIVKDLFKNPKYKMAITFITNPTNT